MSWNSFSPKLHRERCIIPINANRDNSQLLLRSIRSPSGPVSYSSIKYPSLARLLTKIAIDTKFFANFEKHLKNQYKIDLEQASRKLSPNEQNALIETINGVSREQFLEFLYSPANSGKMKGPLSGRT